MTTKTSASNVDVLVGSPRQEFWDEITEILKGFNNYKLKQFKSVDEILEATEESFHPVLALIDGMEGTALASEWSQAARMTHEKCPIMVLHNSSIAIDFAMLKKNGASEIMHIQFDREFIADMVLQLAPVHFETDDIPVAALMPVDLRDMDPGSELNFDLLVHLPSNQKTILYKKTGDTIEEKNIEKFAEQKQNMYVKKTQMKAFFEYARTVQTGRDSASPVSITEKFHRSKKSIFVIMSNFMNGTASDLEEGRRILAECNTIIETLELVIDRSPSEIFTEIGRFAGNTRTNYHDAITVAAYAAFFAQLLEMPPEKRQEAALAGLLHNIGLVQAPPGSADHAFYPVRSVSMVKSKRVALSPDISLAIEQHREFCDGTGLPLHLPGDKIHPFSRLLMLAYHFHTMTVLDNGKLAYTPPTAIKFLQDDSINGTQKFDLIMITKLYKALIQNKA